MGSLSFYQNNLTILPEASVGAMPFLYQFDISQNPMISSLPQDLTSICLLYAEYTNIKSLNPSLVASLIEYSLFGSPYCSNDVDIVENIIEINACSESVDVGFFPATRKYRDFT
jgi:hypothetical protein